MSRELKRLTLLAAIVCTGSSRASITMTLDILDADDPGGSAPADRLVVDVFVDVSSLDFFYVGGIRGVTDWGATLVYSDGPRGAFYPPESGDHHTSFGSVAYGRDESPRYAPAGTIAQQGIDASTSYSGGAFPFLAPTFIDVAYYASPPASIGDPDAPAGRDGWTLRIALDISAVDLPGSDDPANYEIFTPGEQPPGYQPVFVSDRGGFAQFGTLMNSVSSGSAGQNWGVYVPEPATGMLMLIGLNTVGRTRRHYRTSAKASAGRGPIGSDRREYREKDRFMRGGVHTIAGSSSHARAVAGRAPDNRARIGDRQRARRD